MLAEDHNTPMTWTLGEVISSRGSESAVNLAWRVLKARSDGELEHSAPHAGTRFRATSSIRRSIHGQQRRRTIERKLNWLTDVRIAHEVANDWLSRMGMGMGMEEYLEYDTEDWLITEFSIKFHGRW